MLRSVTCVWKIKIRIDMIWYLLMVNHWPKWYWCSAQVHAPVVRSSHKMLHKPSSSGISWLIFNCWWSGLKDVSRKWGPGAGLVNEGKRFILVRVLVESNKLISQLFSLALLLHELPLERAVSFLIFVVPSNVESIPLKACNFINRNKEQKLVFFIVTISMLHVYPCSLTSSMFLKLKQTC